MWEVPEFPEMNGDPEWSTVIRTEHTIDASVQEMAENAVDSAHFRFVHNTAEVPELEEYTTGFPEAVMRSSQKFPTPRGVMEGKIDTHAWGPGLSLVNFSGIVDTLNLAVTTPIEADRCIVRFSFRFKTMGDEKTTRNVGKAFVAEVDKQVREDKPIWEHKAHLVRPGAGRQRRPVHEVPQVGSAVLRRARGRRPPGVPAPVLARPGRRGAGQGDRVRPLHGRSRARELTPVAGSAAEPRAGPPPVASRRDGDRR